MPGYQQMIQQMQKTQREFERKQKELDAKEFEYTANGVVKVTLKGNMELVNIEILDKDIITKDDEDMLIDMIKLAYNGCKAIIDKANEDLANSIKFSGMPGLY